MTPPFRVTLTRGATSRDITDALLEMRWRLGMAQPYDTLAAPAAGELLLDNRDQAASPELDADDLFAPGTAVVIAYDDGDWQPLFTGVVARTVPDMGEYGQRRTTVFLEGADAALARLTVRTAVLADVFPGDAIAAILDTPPLDAIPRSLARGALPFVSVGDQWDDGLRADSAIRQIAAADRGRVHLTRDGTLTFRSRHTGLSDLSPHLTLNAEAETAALTYGSEMINAVRISLRPRAAGAPATTLWTLANAQRLRPGAQLSIIAPLHDGQGRRAGAVSVITPVAYTDFTANLNADGSGMDMTAHVSVTVLALEGSAARLQLTNSGTSTMYLQAGARLRGTPLLEGQPVTIEASDAASIAAYGQWPLSLSLPLLDSVEAAHDLAAWEVQARPEPHGRVTTLTLSDRVRYADALPLTLFSRVRLIDPHTGHDGVYAIVAEAHTVTRGGLRHSICYTLEPVPPYPYWTLGLSHLGTETRLAV